MGQLFSVILSLSISGGMVGLMIVLFRPLTGRCFTKLWTYYMWFLVLAMQLLPVHVDVNLMEYLSVRLASVESGPVAAGSAVESTKSGEDTASDFSQNGYSGMAGQTESVVGTVANDADMAEAAADVTGTEEMAGRDTKSGRRELWLSFAGIFWIFGVLIAAFRKIISYQRFAGAVRAASALVTDDRVYRKSAEIQMRLGLGKRVPIYESAVIDSPMLIGILEPRIYMPSSLLAEMDGKENDICLILHHELVHYKRKDIWYKWLFQAALCVHWFNPLLYVFNRKFNTDCELACDEKVMILLSEEGRRAYGNVLLDVAQKNLWEGNIFRKNPIVHKNVPTMTLLEEKHTLKERLRGIAHYHKNGIAVGLCSAVVLVMFLAVAVVCGAAGVRAGGGNTSSMYRPMLVSSKGNAYRMYDDDALIAGDSENDVWNAYNYCGGDGSVNISKFAFNGSDSLWILYANKETTLEVTSEFSLRSGRFKVVFVGPDQTVQTLNESGEKSTVKITLSEGRNVIKMVGQKARLEDINIAYDGIKEEDFDSIYVGEDLEYSYQMLEGKKPLDLGSLEEAYPYLKKAEVSELYREAWKEGVVLSDENWEDLFVYSDAKLSAGYLAKALREGTVNGFSDKVLNYISPYVSTKSLTDIVTAMGKDELSFDGLIQYVLPFVQKQDEAVTCICYYIDLGNALTDAQLREVQGYVSEEDFYRVVEYNGKRK